MNNKILHIIRNEFTRNIRHPDEWWDKRLKVYKYYCLASIINQTNKNFILLMDLDWVPEHIQEKIKNILEESKLEYILRDIKKITLKEALTKYSNKYKYVYNTRIDSDDLFRKEVVEEIQSYSLFKKHSLIFQKGYCYNVKENKLRHYFMPSPPFSTIVYPMNIYLDEQKQQKYRIFRSHDTLIQKINKMPYDVLSENKFIVNAHDTNRVTTYLHNYTLPKKYDFNIEIKESQVENILKDFNISSKTYKEKIEK